MAKSSFVLSHSYTHMIELCVALDVIGLEVCNIPVEIEVILESFAF